jgi:hypothetical protein
MAQVYITKSHLAFIHFRYATHGEINLDNCHPFFISDNQKADLAKIMLDALQMTPPEPGTIPAELMNVTTDNADAVIKYIQSLNSLDGPLSLKNDSNENSLAGALKDI